MTRLACCRLSTGEEQEQWFPFFCKGLGGCTGSGSGRGRREGEAREGPDRNSEEDNSREEAGEQLGP